MNVSNRSISLYMALIFMSGVLVGALGHRSYSSSQQIAANVQQPAPKEEAKGKGRRRLSPEEWRQSYLRFMKRSLELSDDQVTQLEAVMDDAKSKMDELMMSTVPEQMAIRQQQDVKIRALLNPTQLTKYAEMLKEREKQLHEMERNKAKSKNKDSALTPPANDTEKDDAEKEALDAAP